MADLAASVRARLLNIAHREKDDFQLVLTDFAIERFLFRLGESPYARRFVLKGAMLFHIGSPKRYRATWDLDLLAIEDHTVPAVTSVIRDLCAIHCDDGIAFDAQSVSGEEIRAQEDYVGVRVSLQARLAGARIPMRIDVGFGDAVVPGPRLEDYPVLLDQPRPRILIYPWETVVAEKIEAAFHHGMLNSRMKDLYDLYHLAMTMEFDGVTLTNAVWNTFKRRGTSVLDVYPVFLSRRFLTDKERMIQWRAFWKRGRIPLSEEMIGNIADILLDFIGPILSALRSGESLRGLWKPGGTWIL
jgi:predicted nucleotidyltransferase component of viral defense system